MSSFPFFTPRWSRFLAAGCCLLVHLPLFFQAFPVDAQVTANLDVQRGNSTQTGLVDERLHLKAKGLLQATLDYGRAWSSGDFLVRIRRGFDSVDRPGEEINLEGTLVDSTEYYRVAFDYPTGRFLVIHHLTLSELDLQRQKEGLDFERNAVVLTAACSDSDNNLTRLDRTGSCRELKRYLVRYPDLESRVREIGFPDFRQFFFAGGIQADSSKRAEGAIGIRGAKGWELIDVVEKRNKVVQIEYKYSTDREAENWAAISEIWEYDPDMLLPIKKSYKDTFSDSTRNREGPTVDYRWIELSGVQVLQSYKMREDVGREIIGVSQVEGVKTLDADFHWFSLNNDIPSTYFDGSMIKDPETALKHVDPLKCGADDLIAPARKPLLAGQGQLQGDNQGIPQSR